MKYLYLGVMYDRNREQELLSLSRHRLSAAANEYQWNNYDGLCDLLGDDVSLLHALPVGIYLRHYGKLILSSRRWTYRGTPAVEMGCLNLPVVKQISRRNACAAHLRHWLAQSPEEEHTVILYSLYLPYLQALRDVRRTNPELKVIVNIPDLPGELGVEIPNPIKAAAANFMGEKALKIARNMDGFVFLTRQMAQVLHATSDRYTVVEGICRQTAGEELPEGEKGSHGPRGILYTGALEAQFGLSDLLDAFEGLEDKDTELWICGSGSAEGEIRKRAEKNPRIRFYGFCSRERVHAMQRQAALLVNPRPADGEYTKYSFPSKTIEYMCSGTPVVMHRLEGIPSEYEDYVFFTEASTADALREAMDRALAMDGRQQAAWGTRARDFVVREKSPVAQTKKMVELAQRLHGRPKA